MKKSGLYILLMILFSMFVAAEDVGIVVLLADNTEYTDCIEVDDGDSVYQAMQSARLDMDWQLFVGVGYFLNAVEGVASGDTANYYWSMWNGNTAGDAFESSSVGASDYAINNDGEVIGFSYTNFDAGFNPLIAPPFYDFDTLCRTLEIGKVQAIVDGDKETIDPGDDIKVKVDSRLEIIVNVENNGDLDLEDVELDVEIESIDDGGDESESDDVDDIRDDEEEDLEVRFDIPLDADDGTFEMFLTVTATDENGFEYERVLEYDVEVDKDKNELLADVQSFHSATCGRSNPFDVRVTNLGENDQDDATINVAVPSLGISITRDLIVDESDFDRKEFSLPIPEGTTGSHTLITTLNYEGNTDTYDTQLYVNCDEAFFSQSSSEESETGIQVTTVSSTSSQLQQPTINSPSRVQGYTEITGAVVQETKTFGRFMQQNGTTIALIVGNIILIGGLALLISKP